MRRRGTPPFAALVAVSLLGAAIGFESAAQPAAPEGGPAELPRGGREILPAYRVVAFCGAPQHRNLGALGIGSPDDAAKRLRRQAQRYAAAGRPIMPAFQLIATIALAGRGSDGKYRLRQPERVIQRYLNAARRARAILVLDVQPGQADFMDEVRALRRWLLEPDVSLALDPEWSMRRGERPGSRLGHTTAGKINQVSAYLADIVKRRELPQKLLLVHQFSDSMIRNRSRIVQRPGIAMTINVDGVGRGQAERLPPLRLSRGPRLRRFQALLRGGHQPHAAGRRPRASPAAGLRRLRVSSAGRRPLGSG
jgi:hypothetical protein